MRLTKEIRYEMSKMGHRIFGMNFLHEDELESYKVKFENFYCETDIKEQTFQDSQSYFSKFSKARKKFKGHPERKTLSARSSYEDNDDAGSDF